MPSTSEILNIPQATVGNCKSRTHSTFPRGGSKAKLHFCNLPQVNTRKSYLILQLHASEAPSIDPLCSSSPHDLLRRRGGEQCETVAGSQIKDSRHLARACSSSALRCCSSKRKVFPLLATAVSQQLRGSGRASNCRFPNAGPLTLLSLRVPCQT